MPKLKVRNVGGWETLVNKDVAVAPYFSNLLRKRVHQKQATNIVVTGEPGEGKSYLAIDIARALMGVTKTGIDRFRIKQVVFTYSQYLALIIDLPMGDPIIFDEPSFAMGKRDWYRELNKALVLTIESQRFKVHPLLIPVVNKSLLDKTIRNYLIQFQIEVRMRGRAVVYRIKPSQRTDKIYHYEMCRLQYNMFDIDLCKEDSCLGCEKLLDCKLFRAQYERKKASIQNRRYEAARDKATKRESQQLTDLQLENILYSARNKFVDEGKIDVMLMRIIARDDFGINIPKNRAYVIVKSMKYHHPNEFE